MILFPTLRPEGGGAAPGAAAGRRPRRPRPHVPGRRRQAARPAAGARPRRRARPSAGRRSRRAAARDAARLATALGGCSSCRDVARPPARARSSRGRCRGRGRGAPSAAGRAPAAARQAPGLGVAVVLFGRAYALLRGPTHRGDRRGWRCWSRSSGTVTRSSPDRTRARYSTVARFVRRLSRRRARVRRRWRCWSRRTHRADARRGGILETTLGGLIGIDGPYTYSRLFAISSRTRCSRWGSGWWRSSRWRSEPCARRRHAEAERERARALVHEHGGDTLDYFALRPDKSYFFTATGDAMLAYGYVAGHALVAGDPIGAPEADRARRRVPRALPRARLAVAFLAVARPTCRCTATAACARSISATRPSCTATRSRRGGEKKRALGGPPRRRECTSAAARDRRSAACCATSSTSCANAGATVRRARLHDGARRRRARRGPGAAARGGDRPRTAGRSASCGSCRASATSRAGRWT